MFTLQVYPTSPICMGGSTIWTLDAILYGILREIQERKDETFSSDAILASLPLNSYFGVFAASAARYADPVRAPINKIGGFRPVQDTHDARFLSSDRGPKSRLPRLRTTQGQHKAHMTRYTIITASRIEWLFDGDPDKVLDIITRADALGACRKEGYGTFDPAAVTVKELDRDWSFLDPETGSLIRQIPVRLIERPEAGAKVETMTWHPPYFANRYAEPCYVPAEAA